MLWTTANLNYVQIRSWWKGPRINFRAAETSEISGPREWENHLQKVIGQLWRGRTCVFVVFFGVGRMADLTRFCRLVESTFSQEGTLSGKMLLHPGTFGGPPCFEPFLS